MCETTQELNPLRGGFSLGLCVSLGRQHDYSNPLLPPLAVPSHPGAETEESLKRTKSAFGMNCWLGLCLPPITLRERLCNGYGWIPQALRLRFLRTLSWK